MKLLKQKKMGFGIPLREWFKDKTYDGYLNKLLDNDWDLDNQSIRKIIDENKQGLHDNGNFIWSLMSLNHYLN